MIFTIHSLLTLPLFHWIKIFNFQQLFFIIFLRLSNDGIEFDWALVSFDANSEVDPILCHILLSYLSNSLTFWLHFHFGNAKRGNEDALNDVPFWRVIVHQYKRVIVHQYLFILRTNKGSLRPSTAKVFFQLIFDQKFIKWAESLRMKYFPAKKKSFQWTRFSQLHMKTTAFIGLTSSGDHFSFEYEKLAKCFKVLRVEEVGEKEEEEKYFQYFNFKLLKQAKYQMKYFILEQSHNQINKYKNYEMKNNSHRWRRSGDEWIR